MGKVNGGQNKKVTSSMLDVIKLTNKYLKFLHLDLNTLYRYVFCDNLTLFLIFITSINSQNIKSCLFIFCCF